MPAPPIWLAGFGGIAWAILAVFGVDSIKALLLVALKVRHGRGLPGPGLGLGAVDLGNDGVFGLVGFLTRGFAHFKNSFFW